MDQVLAGCQEAPCLHRDVARHLHHPRCIGMRRDASHMDLPAPEVDEEEDVVTNGVSRLQTNAYNST
jgi:hypothetical protein